MNFTLNHIALSITNVNKAIDFYQAVFNFKEIENTASGSKTRWLLINEGKQLHLIPRPDAEIKINKAVHFALSTANFDAFVNHLKTLSIAYSDWKNTTDKSYIRKDGIRQIYFQDIDGYWIEINDDV
ncbi:VOC family protein [Winogradskyella litorisediminis]|uniref:VOC family protein n=1 Tax=Winogradskyella litorisediminis TaxID=1156618 RepID=A0ABW3N4A6_9FLAO